MSELTFSKRPAVQIMAVDGSWRRDCAMVDISPTGTTLAIEGSLDDLSLREFVLRLSSRGNAHRLCELVSVSGSEIAARFLEPKKQDKKGPRKKVLAPA